MSQTLFAGLAALVLAGIHIASPLLERLRGTPRSIWLSGAGGVSVAYVFVHMLPELSHNQSELHGALGLEFLSHHVYLVAILGLLVFYGLDRLALASRQERKRDEKAQPPRSVFWVHIVTVGIYNLLVGYLLLHREEPGVIPLMWFVIAIGLHFLVADFGIDDHHERLFRRIGRWLIAGMLLIGYALGTAVALPSAFTNLLFAFVSGAIILNVLKEEVPDERESRFGVFAAAALGYSALITTT